MPRVLHLPHNGPSTVHAFEDAPFRILRRSVNALIACTDESFSRKLWGTETHGVWWHTAIPANGKMTEAYLEQDGYVCGFNQVEMTYMDYDMELPHQLVLNALDLFRQFTKVDLEFWAEARQTIKYVDEEMPPERAQPFKTKMEAINLQARLLLPGSPVPPPPFVDSLERAKRAEREADVVDVVQFIVSAST